MKKYVYSLSVALLWGLLMVFSNRVLAQMPMRVETEHYTAITFSVAQTGEVWVLVEKQRGKPFRLNISDAEGKKLLVKELSRQETKSFISLNLNHLVDGTYFLELSDEKTPIQQVIRKGKAITEVMQTVQGDGLISLE